MNSFFTKRRNFWIVSIMLEFLELSEVNKLSIGHKSFYYAIQTNDKIKKIAFLKFLELINKASVFTNLNQLLKNNAEKYTSIISQGENLFKKSQLDFFKNNQDILGDLFNTLPSQLLTKNFYNDLYRLNLSDLELGENSFKLLYHYLSRIKKLNFLELNFNQISEESLEMIFKGIVNNNQINDLYIDLESCELTNSHLKIIKNELKNLNKNRNFNLVINLFSNNFNEEGVLELIEACVCKTDKTKLKFILHKNNLSSEILKYFFRERKFVKTLENFDLSYNKINDFSLVKDYSIKAKTSRQFAIEELNFSNNQIEDSSIFHLFFAISKGIYCKSIDLSSNLITFKGIPEILNSLSQLENKKRYKENELTKKISETTENSYQPLKKLDLSNNNIQDEGISLLSHYLEKNSDLEELNLSETSFINCSELFNSLNFCFITKLHLNGNTKINLNSIVDYLQTSTLKEISLNYCKLDDSHIYAVKKLITLGVDNLNLVNNKFSNIFLIQLGEFLASSNKHIKYLNVSYGHFYDEYCFENFCGTICDDDFQNLSNKSKNKYINTYESNIQEIRFNTGKSLIIKENVYKFLKNKNLKKLDLSHNKINKNVFTDLMYYIMKFSNVEYLSLSENGIDDIDISKFCFFVSNYYTKSKRYLCNSFKLLEQSLGIFSTSLSNFMVRKNSNEKIEDNDSLSFNFFNLKYLKLNSKYVTDIGISTIFDLLENLTESKTIIFEVKNSNESKGIYSPELTDKKIVIR